MKGITILSITTVGLYALSGNVLSEENQQAEAAEPAITYNGNTLEKQNDDNGKRVNLLIDFSDYSGGTVYEWLKSKGFNFCKGAKSRKLIDLSAYEGALVVKAQKPVRGFIFNESADIKEFSKVRIEWGIAQYPKDASYEKNNMNEALIVYVFFGYKKMASGSFLLPKCRYFIGLFLSKDDEVNKPYQGNYYHKGGRFVCLGNPKPNETVVSEFDLVRAFRAYFNNEVPEISGFSLGVDTSTSGDGGKAAAFIKRIEFIK